MKKLKNILIISEMGNGKSTLLRHLQSELSINGYDVTLRNIFVSSQEDNVVSFDYDLCESIKAK